MILMNYYLDGTPVGLGLVKEAAGIFRPRPTWAKPAFTDAAKKALVPDKTNILTKAKNGFKNFDYKGWATDPRVQIAGVTAAGAGGLLALNRYRDGKGDK